MLVSATDSIDGVGAALFFCRFNVKCLVSSALKSSPVDKDCEPFVIALVGTSCGGVTGFSAGGERCVGAVINQFISIHFGINLLNYTNLDFLLVLALA